ncbi:hypothetical protein SAMN05216338_101328 [Bradyrhizobium sp. Rc2d]|uniref:hypothetical protein n=1 Tax=Bradyrhizobium sp. Rc2d TaxID=1855321 RepID=UPI00088CE02D|nr:hypothetical protein [Bradyrhizobium sp. Rc2d]SDH76971.1 hypothetical protein SAMN05216338_101328 [Bradyrhizobium sp. Rc2d]
MTGKKQKKPKNVTAAQKKDFWEEHLPYEIEMMRAIHHVALQGSPTQAMHNAMIESLMVHCRNLIEFFKYNPPCDFSPTFFTEGTFRVNRNFINKSLYDKINQQISHLTSARTSVSKDKLGPYEWGQIIDAIEKELVRMEAALTPAWRADWKFTKPTTVQSGSGTGSSSQIATIGGGSTL